MSDENIDPELQTWIEPEIEARIVAAVLGEASEFEAAELARIIAEKPELAIFKHRIESVHGLVVAASRIELDPMRLAEDRRRKLLETLGGKEAGAQAAVVALPQQQADTGRRSLWNWAIGIAACLMVATVLMGLLFPALNASKNAAKQAAIFNDRFTANERTLQATAAPASAPQSFAIAAPASPAAPQNLAALDALKALASRSRTEEDDAADAPVTGETRSEQLWSLDNGWQAPVHKFADDSAEYANRSSDVHHTDAINKKLNNIIIPKIEFRDATVSEALDFLKEKSRELDTQEPDPTRRGINIVDQSQLADAPGLPPPAAPVIPGLESAPAAAPASNEARITLSLKNIPLIEALKYVGELANLKVKVDPYAVSVVPPSVNTEELITKEYTVPPSFLSAAPNINASAALSGPATRGGGGGGDVESTGAGNSIGQRQSAMDFLTSQGVQFPPGATAEYFPATGKLIVHNTESNIELLEASVEAAEPPAPLPAGISQTDENRVAGAGTTAEAADSYDTTAERKQSFDYLKSQGLPIPGLEPPSAPAAAAAAPVANAGSPSGTSEVGPVQEQQLTAGLRSGSYAISPGAIDALLSPAPAAPAPPGTLSGANTYSGSTAVSGGTMRVPDAAAPVAHGVAAESQAGIAAAAPVAAPATLGLPEPTQADMEAGKPATAQPEDETAAPLQASKQEAQQMQDNDGYTNLDRWKGAEAGKEVKRAQPAAPAESISQDKEFGMAATTSPAAGASATSQLAFNLGTQTVKAREVEQKVPILGDIPVLGRAFQSNVKKAEQPVPLPQDEISASDQPYSTFSLHVSDVSFLLACASLANGQLPDPASIRPEEFYNAFDYGDPSPATGEKIACRIEQAAHPFLQQRNLIRIAMKVAATGRGQGQPLRLTVLLDTSGSMEREDRAASVQRAMEVLTSLLGPGDAVTLIGFARQPRLLAEEVPGDQAGKLVDIVKHTPAEGGTNMEEALKTASELALRHFEKGAQNRIVMLTDGAANLGDADPAQLSKLVGQLRQQGVSFDACGVGADGLNDDILEALTRKGGGRYYFLNQPEDADQGFARQLAGAFRPAAENVKMQVRFNPARVGNYRLIGFEKNRLNQEDFRNDKVTAAQLAAEEAGVALYQVQVLPEGEGEVGEVFVRFLDPSTGRTVEQSWTIPYDPQAPALDKASPSMQLAATASLIAEKLRGGPLAEAIDLDALAPIVAQLRGDYPRQTRVQDLAAMFEQVRRLTARK